MNLEERWEATMLPNYGTPQLQLVQGEGANVTDADGRSYVDLLAGLAVNVLGHAHPAVVATVASQIATLGHVSNLYATEPALELAERLSERTGGYHVAQLNSGSEANELAYKIVRRHAHHQGVPEARVLAFEGSFHGRTTGALGLTGQPAKHAGFGPFPGVIEHVPYNDIHALEAAFEAGPIAGVFVEYLQGEGGIVPIEPHVAQRLHELADEVGALVVADEVQTGIGRTGRFFAHEHHGVQPDLITVAKALGGGLPASACLVRPDLAELMGPGSHGCTFGGNPVACAAANTVLDVYDTQDLARRARQLGGALTTALQAQGVGVRGQGLLLGVPLDEPVAGDVAEAAAQAGLLVGTAGDHVVRLAPPLTIEEDVLLATVAPLVEALQAAKAPTVRA